MNPSLSDELAKLKDAHELGAIGWWPPAVGWWLLAAALLLAVATIAYQLYPYWKLWRYQRFFLRQLNLISTDTSAPTFQLQLQQLNQLLKTVALLAFPRQQVAGLTGANWATFLRDHGPKNRTLIALQQALGEQQFQCPQNQKSDNNPQQNGTEKANISPKANIELWRDAQAWVGYVLSKHRQNVLLFGKQNPQKTFTQWQPTSEQATTRETVC